jgi:uncharacterized protein YaiL (DUF2058 family)
LKEAKKASAATSGRVRSTRLIAAASEVDKLEQSRSDDGRNQKKNLERERVPQPKTIDKKEKRAIIIQR